MALPLIYCPPLSGSDESFDQASGEHPLLISCPSGSLQMPLPNYLCTPIFGNLTPPPNQLLPGITPLKFLSPFILSSTIYIFLYVFLFVFFLMEGGDS